MEIPDAAFFFLLADTPPIPHDNETAEERAASMRAYGIPDPPVLTIHVQYAYEVAVRDANYERALDMLRAHPELLKHMMCTAAFLRWSIVQYARFRTAYPDETRTLDALQARRAEMMKARGLSD